MTAGGSSPAVVPLTTPRTSEIWSVNVTTTPVMFWVSSMGVSIGIDAVHRNRLQHPSARRAAGPDESTCLEAGSCVVNRPSCVGLIGGPPWFGGRPSADSTMIWNLELRRFGLLRDPENSNRPLSLNPSCSVKTSPECHPFRQRRAWWQKRTGPRLSHRCAVFALLRSADRLQRVTARWNREELEHSVRIGSSDRRFGFAGPFAGIVGNQPEDVL